jgi:hypothetical protein
LELLRFYEQGLSVNADELIGNDMIWGKLFYINLISVYQTMAFWHKIAVTYLNILEKVGTPSIV